MQWCSAGQNGRNSRKPHNKASSSTTKITRNTQGFILSLRVEKPVYNRFSYGTGERSQRPITSTITRQWIIHIWPLQRLHRSEGTNVQNFNYVTEVRNQRPTFQLWHSCEGTNVKPLRLWKDSEERISNRLSYGTAVMEATFNHCSYSNTVKNRLLTASAMARQWWKHRLTTSAVARQWWRQSLTTSATARLWRTIF